MRPLSHQQEQLPGGFELGAYRIVRCIGAGGMGVVYEAEHRALHKRVALKALNGQAAANPASRARFIREGTTASQIRHPHVVDVTDVGEEHDIAFLVMELLEGESLGELLEREHKLPTEQIVEICLPVVAALVEAHARGIIHRDLKPDNIFLTRSVLGRVHPKVLDFGISKVLDEPGLNLTATFSFLGTPYYASPEQLTGTKNMTARTDQYSLGVVLYEAATGQNPFAEHDSLISILSAIGAGRVPRPSDLSATVDRQLEPVFLKAMSLSPTERFESIHALGAALLPMAAAHTRAVWSNYFSGRPGPSPSISAVVNTAATQSPRRNSDIRTIEAPPEKRTIKLAIATLALLGATLFVLLWLYLGRQSVVQRDLAEKVVAPAQLAGEGSLTPGADANQASTVSVEATTASPNTRGGVPLGKAMPDELPTSAAPLAPPPLDRVDRSPTERDGNASSATTRRSHLVTRSQPRTAEKPHTKLLLERPVSPDDSSTHVHEPQPTSLEQTTRAPKPGASKVAETVKTDNINPFE
jgi:serine/threonine protein kinase